MIDGNQANKEAGTGLGYLWTDMPSYLTRNLAYEGLIVGAYYGMYQFFEEDLKKASLVGIGLMGLRLVALSLFNTIQQYLKPATEKETKNKIDPIHWFEFLFCFAFALVAVARDNEAFLKVQPAIQAVMIAASILIMPLFTKSAFCKTMFGNLMEKYYPAHKAKIAGISDKEWKGVDYACAANLVATAAALLLFGKFCPDDLWIYLKYPVITGCNLPGMLYSYNLLKPHLAGEKSASNKIDII